MATLNSFDPVGSFQRGRSNTLAIQSQEQGIQRGAAAAPIRNQLADLNLEKAKVGAARQSTQFDQEQALQRAKILNQTMSALKGLPQESRHKAMATLSPELQKFGIDATTFVDRPLDDADLDLGLVNTQALIDSPQETIRTFGRVVEGEKDGKRVFFQAGTEEGQRPRVIEGLTPPESQAAIAFKTKQLEVQQKKEAALESKKQQAGIVSLDIDRALEQAQGALTTGFTGSLASAVPGTPAFDLKNTLNTIKANVGFNKLQDMRENSPTGGALGNVTENENRLLQSVFGSVEQSQSQEQLNRNLNRLKVIFDAVVHGTTAIPFTQKQFEKLPVGARYISPDTGTLHEKK